MGLLRRVFGPSKDEIWKELSRQIGAKFVDGGFWNGDRVDAEHGPWIMTLDTYVVSTGKSTITYTRMRAPYVNRDGFQFHIYRTGILSALGVFLGMQDIKIGDAAFDDQFVIKSSDSEQVEKLLASDHLREVFLRQPSVSLRVADDEGWFGKQFPEGVDELHFQVVGVIKDIDRLKALFDLFAETLHRLCEIGSAYETPPFAGASYPDADKLLRPAKGDDLLRPAPPGSSDPESLVRPSDAPPSATPAK